MHIHVWYIRQQNQQQKPISVLPLNLNSHKNNILIRIYGYFKTQYKFVSECVCENEKESVKMEWERRRESNPFIHCIFYAVDINTTNRTFKQNPNKLWIILYEIRYLKELWERERKITLTQANSNK